MPSPHPPWMRPSHSFFPLFCGFAAYSTLVIGGFVAALVPSVACHRQDEFPGSLIPLSTLPSKCML